MTRSLSIVIRAFPALAVLLVPTSVLHAQRAVTLQLELPVSEGSDQYTLDPDEERIKDYFNLARCQCAEYEQFLGDEPSLYFRVKLTVENQTVSDEADLAVGSNCENVDPLLRNCETIESQIDAGTLLGISKTIAVNRLMFPNDVCQQEQVANNVWILYDDGADDIIDEHYTLGTEISSDALPPPELESMVANPAESAVEVTWDYSDSRFDDIEYVYVLCMDEDGMPVFGDAQSTVEYDTTMDLCGVDLGSPDPDPNTDAGVPDAGVGAPDAGINIDASPGPDAGSEGGVLADLNEAYICGRTTSSATSLRIEGLENGRTYDFALVTVDEARNPTYMYVGQAEPKPADDFWEYYNDRGGQAEGGVCLVTSTFGDGGPAQALRAFRDNTLASFGFGRMLIAAYYDYIAPLGVYAEQYLVIRIVAAVVIAPLAIAAALWEYTGLLFKLVLVLGLFGWRRRKRLSAVWYRAIDRYSLTQARFSRTRAAALGAAVAIFGWATPVSAQAGQAAYDAYWEDFAPVEDALPIQSSKWNFGIKLGPYLPDVDSEFSLADGASGPYAATFGGNALMTQFELERFFLFPAGQLGISASIGWMSNSAAAFETCPEMLTPDQVCDGNVLLDADGNPARSTGDSTSFRMMPAFLGVVYRLTAIDDQVKIPLVPYGKAGFSYYLWWITAPDGSFARSDGDRALGGSLGVQATLGLALRAERLDKGAAMNLRNDFGIEHAGIYAEVTYAKVDGFGSDKKLAVGDFTWFAGLNFEF